MDGIGLDGEFFTTSPLHRGIHGQKGFDGGFDSFGGDFGGDFMDGGGLDGFSGGFDNFGGEFGGFNDFDGGGLGFGGGDFIDSGFAEFSHARSFPCWELTLAADAGFGGFDNGFDSGLAGEQLGFDTGFAAGEDLGLLGSDLSLGGLDYGGLGAGLSGGYDPFLGDGIGLDGFGLGGGLLGAELAGDALIGDYGGFGNYYGGLWDNYGTGFYNPALSFGGYGRGSYRNNPYYGQYGDLLGYQQSILANRDLAEAERLQLWQNRLRFEEMNDAQQQARWNNMSFLQRARLGLHSGYYGSRFGGPNYYQRAVNTGFGNIGSRYPLSRGLEHYNNYLQPQYASQARWHDDAYINANDLGTFANQLRLDQSLAARERQRRWEARQQFEMLNQEEQRRRWQQMAEANRLKLGLGAQGYAGMRFAPPNAFDKVVQPAELRPMQYPLPGSLRQLYQTFLNGPPIQKFEDLAPHLLPIALAYTDLNRFENRLRDSRLDDRARERLWRARLDWQQLNEAQRRAKWWSLSEQDRQALGLEESSYWGQRYSRMGRGFASQVADPSSGQNMGLQGKLPPRLAERFRPFEGHNAPNTSNQNNADALASIQARQQQAQMRMDAANHRLADLDRAEATNARLSAELDRAQGLEGRITRA